MRKRVSSATEEMAFLLLTLLLLIVFLWQNHHILYDSNTQANLEVESLEQTKVGSTESSRTAPESVAMRQVVSREPIKD